MVEQVEYITYPRTKEPEVGEQMVESIVECFDSKIDQIKTNRENGNKSSKTVQKIISPELRNIGFKVEEDDIINHHIYSQRTKNVESEMDAFHPDERIRVEIEGSRAMTGGYHIYRDLYYAEMMEDLDMLCIAVPRYCGSQSEESFKKIIPRLDAYYEKKNVEYEVLLIGY